MTILAKVRGFLQQTKDEFQTADLSQSVLVFGNESTDLDSIVCAVLVAEALRKLYKVKAFPVLNTFRPETLKMRGEVTCCLGPDSYHLMISLSDALLRTASSAPGTVQVFLVDHNELSLLWPPAFAAKVCVVGIIDHHFDCGKFHNSCKYGRVIQDCGSNTSLVVREVFSHPETHELDRDFMKIALFPIIFDTKHYRFRAIDLDFKATRLLLDLLTDEDEHVRDQTSSIWKQILDSELDELVFGLHDLLYKDYKQYRLQGITPGSDYILGMATIRSPLEGHLQRSGRAFPDIIEHVIFPFFRSEHLHGLMVIFSYQDDVSSEFQQEFLMLLPGLDAEDLVRFFSGAGMEFSPPRALFRFDEEEQRTELCTVATASSPQPSVIWIPQSNRLFNRKKVQPLLQEFIRRNSQQAPE